MDVKQSNKKTTKKLEKKVQLLYYLMQGCWCFSCVFNVFLLKSINCHVIFNLWLSSTTFFLFIIINFLFLNSVHFDACLIKNSAHKNPHFLWFAFAYTYLFFSLFTSQYTASNNGRPWEFFQVISFFFLFFPKVLLNW